MAEQAHFNVNRAFTANNAPSAGALAYFYESGTTTPLTVYSDEALTTPHASPLVADAEGVFDPVYVSGSVAVKVEVKSAAGATLTGYPIDPVMLDGTSDSGAAGILFTPTTTNTATDVQAAIENNDTAIQALEASIANPFTIMTTAGAGNAFTGVAAETVTAYAVGQEYLVKFDRAPTGAATMNIDGAGVKNIKKYDSTNALADIAVNDWIAGHMMKLTYDGTQFIAHGPFIADALTQGIVFFLDEDDLVSDRADAVSSQQAIKAYVDAHDVGVGQTWQDVSGSRAHSTSYQNTTGKPIMVAITGSNTTARTFEASTDNATWITVGSIAGSGYDSTFAVIPDDHYYRINGVTTFQYWAELR